FPHGKGAQELPREVWIPIPGGAPGIPGGGTQGSGLGRRIGHSSDSMLLELFSIPSNPGILQFWWAVLWEDLEDQGCQGPPRCSSLQAPIMLLSGHEGEVYCCKFHPNGNTLASAGFDRLILLWNVYGDCDNFATLKGHSGAVMELHYNTDGSMLFSASTDKTVAVWDSETGERVKRLKGHTSFVNSCYPARRGPQLVCTGSDDGTVKLWDIRKKAAVQTFQNTYQVLAVTFNDTSDQIISGGIDNDIKVWDLRQNKLTYTMRGHADSVTGLSLSSEGSYLLSNAMDNTGTVFDFSPAHFSPGKFLIFHTKTIPSQLENHLGRELWVFCPQQDLFFRFVYVWDTTSRRILYKLPGHAGSVNELAFHPEEPIKSLEYLGWHR
uniref:U5 small nuclear ribonucleoprotein 40 kDa protein n=1 Tax=Zosterops lateralis melanops TaxID=1220523 RepID=A0A8D2PL50_ZOSLA